MKQAAVLMLFIVVIVMGSWELYLRHKGLEPSYDDSPALWADKRAMVYEPSDKAVVFAGSSRIKYDLDITTFEQLTGKHAIQLGATGDSPRKILENLADDPNFKGNLVVDVTEILFFPIQQMDQKATENLACYNKRTPAERASFVLNRFLESQFVFLDKYNLSTNAKLEQLQISSRPGIFMMPNFPIEFERTDFNGQCKMSPRFLTDTALQQQVKNVWKFFMGGPPPPPFTEEQFAATFAIIKSQTDKIKARGGEVVFTRTPSSGFLYNIEKKVFPRAQFWDRLLKETGCKGFYFTDYPETAGLICPEESHLSPSDAVIYTKALVNILTKETNFAFQNFQTK